MMKKKQTFILKDLDDAEISAMKYHFSRTSNTTMVAVSMKSSTDTMPLARIYYVGKKASFNFVHSHLNTNIDIIDMVFILKGKFFVTLAEIEEGSLYQYTIWNVEQEKLVHSEKIPGYFTEMEQTLASSKYFSIAGPDSFRIFGYEITEKQMIDTSAQESYFNATLDLAKTKDKIKCHCWMKPDNTLIICTLRKVFVFKHNEIKHILDFILPENEIVTLLTDFIISDP